MKDINYSQITLDDMPKNIRFFKIPKYVYKSWTQYAKDRDLLLKPALTEILKQCSGGCWYEYYGEQPYNNIKLKSQTKEFTLNIPKCLLPEIYDIFMQTHYKIGSEELNKEILTRLAIILKETGYL